MSSLQRLMLSLVKSFLVDVWRETKRTVVYVTHIVAEAAQLADRVIVFSPRRYGERPIQNHAAEAARHFERGVFGISKGDRRSHRRTRMTFNLGFSISAKGRISLGLSRF
jgi:ABC-type nitrate/sulfonate/bicarbonate transport system ATPase subunit